MWGDEGDDTDVVFSGDGWAERATDPVGDPDSVTYGEDVGVLGGMRGQVKTLGFLAACGGSWLSGSRCGEGPTPELEASS